MRTIRPGKLTAETFAPFGEVIQPPAGARRVSFDGALSSRRPTARPSLSIVTVEEKGMLPLEVRRMERHAFSSQTFLPLGQTSFLIVVAPHSADGRPDTARARAILAEGGIGVTYVADVWHHPLTVLAPPARFAIWMWLDGGPGDEEFVDVDPFVVRA